MTPSNALDLIGRKFGRLTVISKDVSENYLTMWLCKCECGKEKVCQGKLLKRGTVNSCGCLRKELSKKRVSIHNGYKDKEFFIWQGMKARCYCVTNAQYPDYGARGISVCERWIDSYVNFLFDMGRCPTELSLDRINNDGNYELGNCRWATQEMQCNNRRSSKYATYKGETLTFAQWCKKLKINRSIIYNNIKRKGWSPEKTIEMVYLKTESIELQQSA